MSLRRGRAAGTTVSLATLARTVAHLKSSQILWRAVHVARLQTYRRLPSIGARQVRPDHAALPAPLPVFPELPVDLRPAQLWRQGFVEYHGCRGSVGDWRGEGQSKLWRYERHYHSELPGLALLSPGDACALVDDWIVSNPPCIGEAWEPYPVARRLLNWSLAFVLAPSLRPHLTPWLTAQLRFLATHLERHLMGNHLLCDLCAIVAAAATVDVADSESLAMQAADVLEDEFDRQALPDGGYAERTAQYHLIVIQDALLAYLLHRARGRELDIAGPLQRMLGWIRTVRRPDGSFPWLNDAAPDVTPPLRMVEALAELAILDSRADRRAVVELPDTGWTIVRQEGHELLFEHGDIGPQHQPGHGHADALSFELVWANLPVVTDTGVTTYAIGDIRTYERSARAHATVVVDGEGSDETWSSFRVGGRARPRYAGQSSPWPGSWLLRGEVRSYRGWRHRRGILFWPGRLLLVCDDVLDNPVGTSVTATLPLAPEWIIAPTATGHRLSSQDLQIDLHVLSGGLIDVVRGEYPDRPGWVSRGFGRGQGRVCLSIAPDEGSRRLLYAFTAPQVGIHLDGSSLIVTSAESDRRISLHEVLA